MGYRFCFGASGAGKSTQLHNWMMKQAGEALDRGDFDQHYLLVVPDQYTMQTQKEMVLAAGERGGILNVDVLSFGRLSHRVFEEVGGDSRGVLDDMGKTLLLRRLVSRLEKDLHVLNHGIQRPGMTAEVKSVISEFMQYGISVSDVGELAECARQSGQGSLAARLQDLQLLYQAFTEDRKERYLTSEETLDLLAEAVPRSTLLAGSIVVFDGFTGFTPVQNRVLAAILQTAGEVIFALDYADDGGTPIEEVLGGAPFDEQDLFYLTRKTASQITQLALRGGVPHRQDWILEGTKRFAKAPALQHLEKALFRYPVKAFHVNHELHAADDMNGCHASNEHGQSLNDRFIRENEQGIHENAQEMTWGEKLFPVHLFLASNPEQEVRQTFLTIRHLIEEKGYCYRDFAIVSGNLSGYEDELRTLAVRYDMPVYLDTNRAILQNPLTETIRGALEIGAGDYSYETVFRLLRSGLSGLTQDQIDRLENYCLKRGIASRKRWETAFDEEFEELRQVFLQDIRPLQDLGRATAMDRAKALYQFLVGIRAGEQMEALGAACEAEGDVAAAMEYRQIYGAVIHLLDELYELLGDELTPAREFQELVEAGFAEIRLGTLPQQVDRILIGDIERTRLSQVKVLFFLGVNDGNIPQGSSKGGLISDLDREFLRDSELMRRTGMELAPTPREQMYIQRLYLYMNLTKPTEELYVSYVKTGADGGSLRPSYLIGLLQQLFPEMETALPEEWPVSWQLASRKDAGGYLAEMLRRYADGHFLKDAESEREFLTMYGVMYDAESRDAYSTSQGNEPEGCSAYGVHQRITAEKCSAAGQQGTVMTSRGLSDLRELRRAAFAHYHPQPLSRETSRKLYHGLIHGSVTRLEMAAECYLRQYLRYGLHLQEREEYTFESADSGSLLHESVQRFGQLLQERGQSWLEYSQEEGHALVADALQEIAGTYREQVLYATERNAYQLKRLQKILEQTVDVLQYQLQKGDFLPAALEQSFGGKGEISYRLPGGGRLVLQGRIDRVDLARSDGKLYIKIVDYKSGNKDLDLRQMRAGLQLQLPLYLEAEERILKAQSSELETVPSAMLYNHFDAPMLSAEDSLKVLQAQREKGDAAASSLEQSLLYKKMQPKGYVGGEQDILTHLDRGFGEGNLTSDVIPVRLKKEGGLYASSHALTQEEYRELMAELESRICLLAEDILAGRTDAAPVRYDENRTACTYCPYQNSCGFDRRTPGYDYREIGEDA